MCIRDRRISGRAGLTAHLGTTDGPVIIKSIEEGDKKAEELLEKYGMKEYIKMPIGELSGGQMQRVFLCRRRKSKRST